MLSWLRAILVVFFTVCVCKIVRGDGVKDDFQTVDVTKLQSHVYGTELILLENAYHEQKSYRFEDFFWTGSGDGSLEPDDENHWTSETSTVYKTKTVVSTVFVEPTTTNKTTSTNDTKCSYNCETTPTIPGGRIDPTPTLGPNQDQSTEENEVDDDFFDADRQFWLLTVLKSDGKDPVIIDLKNSLAKLYKTAFQRQQERHLGITNRIKREIKDKPVKVYIHKVDKSKLNGDEKIEVLYHVAVSGKPVAAVTAADDMTLVSDEEVRQELGYPFLVKAEPYLKAAEPQSLSRAENTWIFIGVSILALLILLLVVAFLTLGLTKRKKATSAGSDNRRHIFERGVGLDNKGFISDDTGNGKNGREQSPTYINFRNQPSNQTVRSGNVGASHRQRGSISSSSSSSTGLDISPLMGVKADITPPKKPPRPKAALNKTVPLNVRRIPPELLDSDSISSKSRDSTDAIYPGNTGVISPKSYLSMPSVKSFPRGNMPEPLNKVLEPVSVLHLDMPEDEEYPSPSSEIRKYRPILQRHGSVGAVEDQGVIGPIVWNMHCQRLQHGVSVDEGIDDLKVGSNVSRMRKRFHDLLDDTFSLFGSRRESPDNIRPTSIEVKSHSATNNRSNEDLAPTPKPRPKTTDPRKVVQTPGTCTPKGAWHSTAPSPLVRPLSAGIVCGGPRINVDHVLAEGKFRSNDPAVPLIAAIKSEIEKCSLPGSTSDLRE